MLSDSESEAEPIQDLTINEHYARAFDYKKEREELEKLREKYGSNEDDIDGESDTDTEDDESEDEFGEQLTPAVDAAILRTLAKIRRKDPEIYKADKDIFGEEQKKTGKLSNSSRAPKDKSKPVTIRHLAIESVLHASSRSPSLEPRPHVEEQRALRDETIAAFHQSVDPVEDDDGLLIPREKTKDELELEEEEYREFLEREVGEDLQNLVTVDGDSAIMQEAEIPLGKKPKKKKRDGKSANGPENQTKREADQEFLMSYILNRGWIDRSANRIPTYGEITGGSKGKQKKKAKEQTPSSEVSDTVETDAEIDEDEFDDIVDVFESSYNFRFEEPDAAVIKSFPRNLPSLVRREDTTRKEARERRKKRKEEELLKKREEIKRLKALKMKEIKAKLEAIGKESGINVDENEALQELDLDGDWNADAHDKQMNDLYAEDDQAIDEKPTWEDDIDIGDIEPLIEETASKKKKKKKKKAKDAHEVDGVDIDVMDAEVERGEGDDEEWDGTEAMRKRKLDDYMDDVYGMDFNDVVGDLPTRFKYASVQPQSYALTPAEILMATDTELNQYMSVKKYAPYRKEPKWDSTRVERLKELKRNIAERNPDGLAGSGGAEAAPIKKRKGKKERQKMKATVDAEPAGGTGHQETAETAPPSKKRRTDEAKREDSVDNLEVGAKKKRRRKKNHQAVIS